MAGRVWGGHMTGTTDPPQQASEALARAAAHFDDGPAGVNGLFDGLRQLGEIVAAARAAHRQQVRDDRNARRRARYRTRPRPPAQPKVPLPDDDWHEHECRCHIVPMPPCSFCENASTEDT